MSRPRRASILAYTAAFSVFVTALFHASGLGAVRRLATDAGGDVAVLLPMLWISFSIDLVALAIITLVVALRPGPASRPVLLLVALPPLAAAVLQLVTIGFVAPTAVLLFDTGLLVAAAIAARPAPTAPTV